MKLCSGYFLLYVTSLLIYCLGLANFRIFLLWYENSVVIGFVLYYSQGKVVNFIFLAIKETFKLLDQTP